MIFEKEIKDFNVRKLVEMMDRQMLDFDYLMQRKLVWRIPNKALLNASAIEGYAINPLYSERTVENGKETYIILDGKQRSHAFYHFIKDSFRLDDLPPVEVNEGEESVDLNGLKFSELPL